MWYLFFALSSEELKIIHKHVIITRITQHYYQLFFAILWYLSEILSHICRLNVGMQAKRHSGVCFKIITFLITNWVELVVICTALSLSLKMQPHTYLHAGSFACNIRTPRATIRDYIHTNQPTQTITQGQYFCSNPIRFVAIQSDSANFLHRWRKWIARLAGINELEFESHTRRCIFHGKVFKSSPKTQLIL